MSHSATHKPTLSKISTMHYIKLIFRSALLLVAAIDYVFARIHGRLISGFSRSIILQSTVWLVFTLEMTLRFFPGKLESMGCQKQLAKNYLPTGKQLKKDSRDHSRLWVAVAWLALNALIGAAYYIDLIDRGILILISLAYSVCDMICILFFCPFQTWFMKNKCCGTCRIYNWDFAMMFTPLLFVGGLWSWSLLLLSLGLLLRWEIAYHLHPERFYEHTNCTLSCAYCQEKLCQHKSQLRHFLKHRAKLIRAHKISE